MPSRRVLLLFVEIAGLVLLGCASESPEASKEALAPSSGASAKLDATWTEGETDSRAESPTLEALEPLDPTPNPEAEFYAMEATLLARDRLSLDHVLTATGAFTANLTGTFQTQEGAALELEARGSFGDQPMDLRLASDGSDLDLVGGAGARRIPAPKALEEAIVLGWTRMGLLHNCARLVSSGLPDHADQAVAEWVTVHGFAAGPTRMINGRLARSTTFTIRVAGTDTATATLWTSAESGLPLERHQTVDFPGGQMKVVERYAIH